MILEYVTRREFHLDEHKHTFRKDTAVFGQKTSLLRLRINNRATYASVTTCLRWPRASNVIVYAKVWGYVLRWSFEGERLLKKEVRCSQEGLEGGKRMCQQDEHDLCRVRSDWTKSKWRDWTRKHPGWICPVGREKNPRQLLIADSNAYLWRQSGNTGAHQWCNLAFKSRYAKKK